jgi:FixJ family two-component response regulator
MTALIAIIDDDAAVRRSLGEILTTYGFRVAEFESGAQFLKRGNQITPNCILLDVRMPRMDGLEVQKHIRQHHRPIPVIFITGHGDIPLAVRAMREGAFDFVEKPVKDEVLFRSIESALEQDCRDESIKAEQAAYEKKFERLTPREGEILNLVVEGHSSTAIGAILGISNRTADHHRAKILEKLEVTSVANLIRVVLRNSGPHS